MCCIELLYKIVEICAAIYILDMLDTNVIY